jgi:hypothetical protein
MRREKQETNIIGVWRAIADGFGGLDDWTTMKNAVDLKPQQVSQVPTCLKYCLDGNKISR